MNSIRASLDVSGRREKWLTQYLHPDWTIAILRWLALQYMILLACKDYRTPQQDVVLMRTRDFSATDMLCELHRLPVRKGVHYKLLILTYKTLNGSAPEYPGEPVTGLLPNKSVTNW